MKKFLMALLITVAVSTSALGATSNDVYLRQDIFEAKMDAFMAEIKLMNEQTRSELNSRIDATNSRIDATNSRIDVTNARLDDLYTMVYWGIALLGILITLAAVAPSLLQVVKGLFQPRFTLEDIERIIDAKLSNKTASI